MKSPKIRQILLITDGCSNRGENPVEVAKIAKGYGISVNVIGVLDKSGVADRGLSEVERIAQSGGGVHQIVYAEQLSQTVQMVTRQAMTQTIQGVVNKQLQLILGDDYSMETLSPEKRGEVMEVVEDLGETAQMEVLVLIDTSASMASKLPMVKEALFDLSISMNARTGDNRFSVCIFPGKNDDVELVLDWTPRFDALTKIFSSLHPGGFTPTGPALRAALSRFETEITKRNLEDYYDDDERLEETV